MATIVTRSGKGSALTIAELDANFNNLNTGKLEETPTRASVRPTLLLDFAKTKTLDPRVSFTRASTATYYDGKTVVKAEENLFQYSQDFTNNYWETYSAVTATGNATTAPDGTTTATQIAASTTGVGNGSFENTVGAPVGSTISVYAKAGDVDYLAIGSANSNAWASFNLSTGLPGNSNACTASMVPVGNGWYRCIMANITSAMTRVLLAMKATDVTADPWSNGSVTAGNYIYIWGAQLEQRSSVTAYTPTTASPITNYIPQLLTAPAGVPRFDHNPVTGESLGLLVEEQRTNFLTYSQQFDNAAWTKNGITASAASGIAPDGTSTANVLTVAATTAAHNLYRNAWPITGTIGVSVVSTLSFYAKAREYSFVNVSFDTGSLGTNNVVSVNLSTGAVSSSGATLVSASATAVGNGWWRIAITGNSTDQRYTLGNLYITPCPTNNTSFQPSFAGDGVSGIFIWGTQMESGSFPTSYIPTAGSQVTRASDETLLATGSWFNPNEFSVSIKYSCVPSGWYVPVMELGTTSSYAPVLALQGYNNNQWNPYLSGLGNGYFSSVCAGPFNGSQHIAVAASTGAFRFVQNGEIRLSNSAVTGPFSAVNQVRIFYGISTSQTARNLGTVSRIVFYPKRLTDAELQAITTP